VETENTETASPAPSENCTNLGADTQQDDCYRHSILGGHATQEGYHL